MSRKNWQFVGGEFSSTSVLVLLSVLSSIATSVKLLSSISLSVRNARADKVLESLLPEKVRTGTVGECSRLLVN